MFQYSTQNQFSISARIKISKYLIILFWIIEWIASGKNLYNDDFYNFGSLQVFNYIIIISYHYIIHYYFNKL